MVRAVGVEPTLLSEPDFESGASTSFTTPAGFATRRVVFLAGVDSEFQSRDDRSSIEVHGDSRCLVPARAT